MSSVAPPSENLTLIEQQSQAKISDASTLTSRQSSTCLSENPQRLMHRRSWRLDDFEVGRFVGRGKFGCVYVARDRETHTVIAIKVLFKSEIEKYKAVEQVRREIQIQYFLRHPNLLTLYGYFHDEKRVFMVLEYAAKGDLYSVVKKTKGISEQLAAKYIRQLTNGLQYMHSKNVIHRDLKLENLLLDRKGDLKVADFGWSAVQQGTRKTLCGTLDYLAPEMIANVEYSFAVDFWAVGVLLYEMLVGAPPFESKNQQDTVQAISMCRYMIPQSVPQPVASLIRRLIVHNPNQRATAEEILSDPWIVSWSGTAADA